MNQRSFGSVADMMRKRPSAAEAHLIGPGWSRRIALPGKGDSRAN